MVQLIESMTWGEIVIACGVAVWFVGLALYVWFNRYAGADSIGSYLWVIDDPRRHGILEPTRQETEAWLSEIVPPRAL